MIVSSKRTNQSAVAAAREAERIRKIASTPQARQMPDLALAAVAANISPKAFQRQAAFMLSLSERRAVEGRGLSARLLNAPQA